MKVPFIRFSAPMATKISAKISQVLFCITYYHDNAYWDPFPNLDLEGTIGSQVMLINPEEFPPVVLVHCNICI